MKERKKSIYTIYSLMNDIYTLKINVKLAYKTYKEKEKYSYIFERQAEASLETLLDVKYINNNEYIELDEQLHHIFRMYERH